VASIPPIRAHDSTQPIPREKDLEATLLSALLNGRSWLPEPGQVDRLCQLCVYQCDSLKWAWCTTEQIQHFPVWELKEEILISEVSLTPLTISKRGFDGFLQAQASKLMRFQEMHR